MDAYLLDTSFVSSYLNDKSQHHKNAKAWLASISANDSLLISVITLGELEVGAALQMKAFGSVSDELTELIKRAKTSYPIVPITAHTTELYAEVKSALALVAMPTRVRSLGKKKLSKPELWTDEVTGHHLGIDENDLWICATSLEKNFCLVSFDRDMDRVKHACSDLRLIRL